MTFKEYMHDAIARKPKLLYHVTFGKETIDNIQQNGLEPKLQLPQNFNGVFFTRTKQKALAIGRSIKWRRSLHGNSMFVLTIDSSKISKLYYDGMYASGVYTTEHVPASAILSVEQVS
jgi:RNA:NAD 2'-phosphotransferase (TPT1/KptA family)